jgi:hypothetical protein
MATHHIYCLYDGTVLSVPFEGPLLADLVGRVVDDLKSKRGVAVAGGVNVFRISRDDGKALKRNADHVCHKEELDELDALDTAPFAGGAHLLLLERKPSAYLGCTGVGGGGAGSARCWAHLASPAYLLLASA